MRSRPGRRSASYQVSTFQVLFGSRRDVCCLNVRVLYHLPAYRARIASMTSPPSAKRDAARDVRAGVGADVELPDPREQPAATTVATASAASAARLNERWLMS